jgi:hypothetical protein
MCMQSKAHTSDRRKIRLIEGYAKCRHLKIDLYKDFAAGVYLSEVQDPLSKYKPRALR